ncbi:methyltransferase [Acetobacterium sp. KB-1]|uniref:methyltransferase n=1 Tax=Acetobacterium sp. KB-1 TaxID=2184575 RepID=UPI000DBECE2C|nr:methyltransferase [Acetobacterium sp. KB-1]AWW27584.1 methyltransferase [Acetobacterium sp. KB-1]
MFNDDVLLNKPIVETDPLYQFLNTCSRSFKQFKILDTAIKRGFFNHLDEWKSAVDLAKVLGTNPDLTDCICMSLAEIGFIEQSGEVFKNSELSTCYFKSESPYFQGEVLFNIKNGFSLWERLDEVIENGPIKVSEADYFKDNLIHSLASEIMCGELQKTTSLIASLPEFSRAEKLLDLGGGHGLYSVALSRLNQNLEIDIYDFPDVIEATQKYLEKYDAHRINLKPGNLFMDAIGNDYDLLLFSYNPGGKNPELVPKIFSALKEGGLFISKHVFYGKDEGSRDPLLDLEYNLSDFEGVKKGRKIYSFARDLTFEAYLSLLEQYFTIVQIVETEDFATEPLSKFGDALEAKMIIAKKKAKKQCVERDEVEVIGG